MKKILFKWFGIAELKKEIADLHTTINTLKNEATVTYKKYEEAFAIIKCLSLENKDKLWWEQDIRYDGKNHEVIRLVHDIKRSKEIEFATSNPSLRINKKFHGGCLGCVAPIERGLGTCTGCKYLMGWDYKDLSQYKKAVQ